MPPREFHMNGIVTFTVKYSSYTPHQQSSDTQEESQNASVEL